MYIKHKIYADDINSIATENLSWEKLAGKSLLLTGASGLIGTVLVDALMKKNRADNLTPMKDSRIISAIKISSSSSSTSTSRLNLIPLSIS